MRKKMDHLFLHYFMTYFILLIVIMLFCTVSYSGMLSIMRKEAVLHNTSILGQAVQILEEQTMELDHFCEYLATSPEVTVFQSEPTAPVYPNTYSLIRLKDSLPAFQTMDTFIYNYFILFNSSQIVANNNAIYPYSQFERLALNYKGMDYEDWLAYMNTLEQTPGYHKATPSLYRKKEFQFIHYSFPLISTSHDAGFVLLLIDSQRFLSVFSELDNTDSNIYVFDQAGELIVSSDTGPDPYFSKELLSNVNSHLENEELAFRNRLGSQNMLITSSHSDSLGFTFICIQPESRILSKVTSLRTWMIILFSTTFLIGIFMSIYLAKKPTESINQILRVIPVSENKSSSHIVTDIQKNIVALKHNNAHMAKILEKHIPYIQRTFLERLLRGDFSTEKEAVTAASAANLNFHNCYFRVVIFRFLSDDTIDDPDILQYLDTCSMSLAEVLDQLPSSPLYTDSEEGLIKALVTYPAVESFNSQDCIEDLIQNIRLSLPPVLGQMFITLVGDPVGQLTEVVRSSENAHTLLHLPWPDSENIFWYEPKSTNECEYFFPADAQHKLFSCISSGNSDELHALLHRLFSRNLIEGNQPYYMQTLFLNELQGNFIRIMNQLNLTSDEYNCFTDVLEELHNTADIKKPTLIIQMYYSLCELIQKRRTGQKESLIQDIISFIEENCMDSSLSLSAIADQYHYSESYISLLLKQYGDIYFSEYVESLRLKKAKDLLYSTTLNISEIAQQVGYLSTNSFCRAFKRYEGCTATEYRKRKRKNIM